MAVEDVINFYSISERVGTSGMPTPAQLQDIADAGYEVVINLAVPGPRAPENEGSIIAGRGLTYIHIPVDFANPTLQDFESFAAVMRINRERKVFVHCAMNFRVSAFMFLYRLVEEEADIAQAKADLGRLWEPEAQWQDLIDEVLDAHGIDLKDQV